MYGSDDWLWLVLLLLLVLKLLQAKGSKRQDAFTLDVLEVPQGPGSGFVWDSQGHIVTNYYVIRGASDLKVTLSDQRTYDAEVVGFDQDKDVAVLHID
ncbi:hypothetical protein ACS0TY_004153 [Phlomoides rotata]